MHDPCDDHCHAPPLPDATGRPVAAYRRVLWLVIAINAGMFAVEMTAGLMAQSVALQADAIDFLGDSLTYFITLLVLGMALKWRASAAIFKGATMGLFGLWVIGNAVYNALIATVPEAVVMGSVGIAALIANVVSAVVLFKYREGDANMRSVWLCTRNDVLGNVAVIGAGIAVGVTATGWPDYAVAAIMAFLQLSACYQILKRAIGELKTVT
ncbi:MAG: cation transporter [Rhodospirillales bacterium]